MKNLQLFGLCLSIAFAFMGGQYSGFYEGRRFAKAEIETGTRARDLEFIKSSIINSNHYVIMYQDRALFIEEKSSIRYVLDGLTNVVFETEKATVTYSPRSFRETLVKFK